MSENWGWFEFLITVCYLSRFPVINFHFLDFFFHFFGLLVNRRGRKLNDEKRQLLVEHWQKKAKQFCELSWVRRFFFSSNKNLLCVWVKDSKKLTAEENEKNESKHFLYLLNLYKLSECVDMNLSSPIFRIWEQQKQRKLRVFYEISKFFIFIGFFVSVYYYKACCC